MSQPSTIPPSSYASFVLSFALHGILIAIIASHTYKAPAVIQARPVEEMVQAGIQDEALVQEELDRIIRQEKLVEQKAQQAQSQVNQLKADARREAVKLENLKKEMDAARQVEEQKLLELRQHQKKEQQRLKQLDEQREAEQARLLQLKQSREAEQKQIDQLKAQKQLEEKQKLAEQARAMDAETQKKNQILAQNQAAEAKQLKEGRLQSEREKMVNIWYSEFKSHWIKPNIPEDITCQIKISVTPEGQVLAVKIVQSSGNLAYDESAVKAVWKASPLRMPNDKIIIDELREAIFGFRNV